MVPKSLLFLSSAVLADGVTTGIAFMYGLPEGNPLGDKLGLPWSLALRVVVIILFYFRYHYKTSKQITDRVVSGLFATAGALTWIVAISNAMIMAIVL